jgi:hypothetical protein
MMLLRASNAGYRMYRGKVLDLPPAEPAIISVTDHQRLVALLNDPSRKTNAKGGTPRWLLSGIVICGRCGNDKVNVTTGGQRRLRPAYTCVRKDAEHPGCYARSWVDEVDAWVGLAIKDRQADPKLGEPGADVAERIEDLHRANAQLKADQIELAESELPLTMLAVRGAKLEAQIKANLDRISALLPSMAQTLKVPWDEATLGERRALIEKLTTKIELCPTGNGRYRTFTPDQVEISWR